MVAVWLSPLKVKKINVLGRYAIVASQPIEGLRPLLELVDPVTRTGWAKPGRSSCGRL